MSHRSSRHTNNAPLTSLPGAILSVFSWMRIRQRWCTYTHKEYLYSAKEQKSDNAMWFVSAAKLSKIPPACTSIRICRSQPSSNDRRRALDARSRVSKSAVWGDLPVWRGPRSAIINVVGLPFIPPLASVYKSCQSFWDIQGPFHQRQLATNLRLNLS